MNLLRQTRLAAALVAGRLASGLSRRLGRGGGTVIAGHVVGRIAPDALSELTSRLKAGSVLISGTNGKTTTARMLSSILQDAGLRPLHNRAGANLLTGLLTAATQDADVLGAARSDVGVFEVDEATLPAALRQVSGRAVVITNLFRDQLDRYGEVDYVAGLWSEAIERLPGQTRLVLNADDPLVARLGRGRSAETIFFGLGDPAQGSLDPPHSSDARLCPDCGSGYAYTRYYYGHLGHYACPMGHASRPRPQVEATRCQLELERGVSASIEVAGQRLDLMLPLPGLYNLYNALAAIACAWCLGLDVQVAVASLSRFDAAFGRVERVDVENRRLFLALVKNPVGFTEVLKTILGDGAQKNLLIVVNDRLADGTDVSWLWDVECELLAGRVASAVCSGLRAEDMAVRLKYAGVETGRVLVENDVRKGLELALQRTEPGETAYVLPTYTAMLEVRELLRQTGYVSGFWED